ncbi:MAG: PIN domain-containing protein [Chloroflexi bacterium]|nr:PIN domain-containing protein [Chloroflexota bacterium]
MNASNAILVDTNILVYTHDRRDVAKQERAQLVLGQLIQNERAVVSVQCLTEFFNAVTRRLPEPMTPADALAQVERLASFCRVLDLTPAVALEGCRGVVQHRLSIWDALIWAAARLNQVPYLLTEDAEHGRFLEGVRFLNPFDPAFDIGMLGR